MTDEIAAFLAAAGWSEAQRAPLAGDASARRYERLRRGRETAVLMVAPPGPEIARFAQIDLWLRQNGFSAPQILAQDEASGLMLLEDLGDALVARLTTADPAREAPLYAAITAFLLDLHRIAPPAFLAPLDGPALGDLVSLTAAWYPVRDAEAARDLPALISQEFALRDTLDPVTCLRDFHAENVLWLPERQGVQRLGLLDFQDAVAAHPAYDLVSALQDARRDVSPALEQREIARYVAARGLDPVEFEVVYALLGAQRALRILGIFSRLCLGLGKPGYLALMPRVWRNLERNLAQPALTALADLVQAAYDPPDEMMLQRMRDACGSHPTP
ncbi:MAG: aminoglycoside phosphotransferase family protein [Paenirhodobacter sp.]|uniref:aminoglycoside phosphotransferase family protein n=1 Tax=Paenirhodobacter sp. TaxID=1965326 RepID=UPI003D0F1FF5